MLQGRYDDVRLHGHRLSAPDPANAGYLAVLIGGGEYEQRGFRVRPGERVIDVGANIGVFSLLAARRGAYVDAYEPHPVTFGHLLSNTEALGVRCHQAAVVPSSQSGTARLWLDPNSDTRHSLAEAVSRSSIEVPAVALDEAIGEGCDLLKLDCEGSEFELIRKVPDDVLVRVGRLVVEVHEDAGDPDELGGRLSGLGFRMWARHGCSEPVGLLFARREGG